MTRDAPRLSNGRLAGICAAVVVVMVGLAFASAPAYRLFCQVTGYEGTPKRAEAAPQHARVGQATIEVRFDASVNRDMPWQFTPEQTSLRVPIGEQTLVSYLAHNPTAATVTGTATFNVTPLKAAPYFAKVACFCFSQQTLTAGESVHMPVSFYVDPAFLSDPEMADVTTITLSYTFFRVPVL